MLRFSSTARKKCTCPAVMGKGWGGEKPSGSCMPAQHEGYHFEHNFGHGSHNLANVLATLNILAFLLHAVQELLSPAYQCLRQALGARKTFFNDLRALTRYMIFDAWDDLLRFIEVGLEIAPFRRNHFQIWNCCHQVDLSFHRSRRIAHNFLWTFR